MAIEAIIDLPRWTASKEREDALADEVRSVVSSILAAAGAE